ncbi:MAG TPA: hypothetical protein VLB90_00420 [Pseudomonadales bacterium]|nr:hypothetical protein [Pseudomonadales bacterium]
MKRLTLIIIFTICASVVEASPESFCNRQPFDSEFLAGLSGNYEIVGRESDSGKAYVGVLKIAETKNSYVLVRTVGTDTVKGEAWVELCSPDKFVVLRAHYETKPKPIELSCYLRTDGDNYNRASCTTFEGSGLEAWYQSNE